MSLLNVSRDCTGVRDRLYWVLLFFPTKLSRVEFYYFFEGNPTRIEFYFFSEGNPHVYKFLFFYFSDFRKSKVILFLSELVTANELIKNNGIIW